MCATDHHPVGKFCPGAVRTELLKKLVWINYLIADVVLLSEQLLRVINTLRDYNIISQIDYVQVDCASGLSISAEITKSKAAEAMLCTHRQVGLSRVRAIVMTITIVLRTALRVELLVLLRPHTEVGSSWLVRSRMGESQCILLIGQHRVKSIVERSDITSLSTWYWRILRTPCVTRTPA